MATARIAGPGETADLRLGNGHQPRTNPSGEWLATLGDLLLTDPAVLRLVRFTASNLVVRRGTLLEHEWRTRRVTIRATEATLLILRVCTTTTTAAHIANEVTRRWPVPETLLSATLAQLVRGGFLLTDILPPDITDNPLGHLLGHLPPDHALARPLAQLQRLLAGAGLAPPTDVTRWRIPVGVPAREDDLGPADLYLVFDGRQLWCWSARHDRPVIPVLYSRLAPHLLPPIARFLQMLGNAGCRPLHAWSWGPLALGPFQPRVRYGPTILTPARWVLPPALTQTAVDRARWEIAFGTWRATTVPAPPAVVVTDDGDHRLPLDLRRDDDRELLRRYTRRGLIAVCEPPGGPDAIQAVITGPNGRHVLELVVPLAARAPAPAAPGAARLVRPRRAGSCGLHLPGGPWLSLAIRAPITCQDEILTQLAVLGGELASHADRWFWLRYADRAHGPHLRIRFHGDPEVVGGVVLPAISAWCADLIRQRLSGGFSVEPYDQEIERYGGPDIPIECAERAFAADSRLVLDVLTATRDPDRRLTVAAVSAAAIARIITDSDPAAVGRHRLDRAARRRFETLRPHARAASPVHDPATAPDIMPGDGAADA